MNQSVKILSIAIMSCIITIALMMLIDNVILVHLGDWTMAMTNKYLVHDWTIIDKNLIRWYPMLIGIVLVLKQNLNYKQFVKSLFWSIVSLSLCITIGIVFALMTWNRGTGYNSLLPDYIKFQPYQYYWTTFIIIGILLPLPIQLIRRNKKNKSSEIIDNKDVYNSK